MISLVLTFGGQAMAQARIEPLLPATQTGQAVKAELTQWLVVLDNGKEVFEPVQSVKPGDLIEYRVSYTNRGSQAVRDVLAELPIPEGLDYQARSARPAQSAEAAVKAGAFAREPLTREGAGGKKEPVPYSEYRRLRWTLGQIAAGAKAEVSARARVSAGVTAINQPSAPTTAQTVLGR